METSLLLPMSGTVTVASELSVKPAGGAGMAGAAAGAGSSVAAGAALASSSTNTKMGEPWLTLSPTLTMTPLTTPAWELGISIAALSLSKVMSESSFLITSPGFTNTSMIDTSLLLPMSGTVTVCSFAMKFAPQTVAGLGFSGSIPYFSIASVTLAMAILPSSANALREAITM